MTKDAEGTNEHIPDEDPRVALPRALKTLAQHVAKYADVTTRGAADPTTDEQRIARRHAILDQQRTLSQLATWRADDPFLLENLTP